MPTLTVTATTATKAKTDAVVVLSLKDGAHARTAATSALEPAAQEYLDTALRTLSATGRPTRCCAFLVCPVSTAWSWSRVRV